MHIPILQDIVIIICASIVVLYVCHKANIPVIVGFLLTGVLIGPHGLAFISSIEEVEILAEIGIVLLLFTIGIEFSFAQLVRIRKPVLLGGSLQVFLTILVGASVLVFFGWNLASAIVVGCLLALSSTAIVLKTLQDRAEVESPYGRTSLAILIFQDIIIVPMIIIVPLLAGHGSENESVFYTISKSVAVVIVLILSARLFVPRALKSIIRTRSREMFLLSVVAICLAIAWLTSLAGLSLGLGAFIAGLIISESEYSHQALEGVLPFKDVFNSFFFTSMGMLLTVTTLVEQPLLILSLVAGVLIIKSVLTGAVALILGLSLSSAIISALTLAQVGEFSFILSKIGLEYQLIGDEIYQLFLATAVLTMVLTPFLIRGAPYVARLVDRLPLPPRMKSGLHLAGRNLGKEPSFPLKGHLVIIGYGINGRNLARAAKNADIPYAIIEANPDTVQTERQNGEPIDYGDASQEAVLRHVHTESARLLVIAISDPTASVRITRMAKKLNANLHVIVRTRFVGQVKTLLQAGADEVIPEEFETSIEIFTKVLAEYNVAQENIEQMISEIRSENYGLFRRS